MSQLDIIRSLCWLSLQPPPVPGINPGRGLLSFQRVAMARIRTIKPEFPQSESMGRVSRDARLTFILLWTLADDSGRLRGNSRMLASLLFPYDLDAGKKIDEWLSELASENCIVRYEVEGHSYVEIHNWLSHQKIDKPSKSKLPQFANIREASANGREHSSGDQGPKDLDQRAHSGGVGETRSNGKPPSVKPTPALTRSKFQKPTLEEVESYCDERDNAVPAQAFLDHYDSCGWVVGKGGKPMKDWRAAIRSVWEPKHPKPTSRIATAEDMANYNPHSPTGFNPGYVPKS